jgi:hypothetical protein
MEVLFILGGVQTNEKSIEPVDEMVVPDMPYSNNIVVDVVTFDIPCFSNPETTPDPEPISLDNHVQPSMPYHHPRHRKNGNHDFRYLQKRYERKNHGPILTTGIECGWIDEWSWVHLNQCLNSSYCCVSLTVQVYNAPIHC